MAYNNTNSNMTTSTGLSAGMQTFFNKTLLENMKPRLIHLQFADTYKMPKNEGLTMNVRKMIPIEPKTDELQEGNPGEGTLLAEVGVNMTIHQFGDFGYFSDKLDKSHMDLTLARRIEMFADAGGLAIDRLCREELATIPNVIYAGGKSARNALSPEDKLTSLELRKAVRNLKKAKAQTFNGYYIGIIGPDTAFDLQADPTFTRVSEYQDMEKIYTGEIGRLYGVRLVETTEAKIFEGAGASGADIASVVILARHAYATIDLEGTNPKVIVKAPGSAGTDDPLDQIGSVGWKMDGFGVKNLQPEFAVRIECGFSA